MKPYIDNATAMREIAARCAYEWNLRNSGHDWRVATKDLKTMSGSNPSDPIEVWVTSKDTIVVTLDLSPLGSGLRDINFEDWRNQLRQYVEAVFPEWSFHKQTLHKSVATHVTMQGTLRATSLFWQELYDRKIEVVINILNRMQVTIGVITQIAPISGPFLGVERVKFKDTELWVRASSIL